MQKPATSSIPDTPGSYQFKDAHGRVIYVGKASSLRSRLASYFQDPRLLHPRTAAMVAAAESVEWIEVKTEVEALMLEYGLIKAHRPRFNIRLRDDKSYPFLAVTLDEDWPRAVVMRGRKRRGTRYFGPYAHAYAIRETLDLLLRSFPVRTCSPSKFNEHERLGRPCLLFHIEKCSGPCVGEVQSADYAEHVKGLMRFLGGQTDGIERRLEEEMNAASTALEYEAAARLRDRLAAVRRAMERQQLVAATDEDIDVFGVAEDDLEASVQVFYVRSGRVVGRRGFIVDKVEALSEGEMMGRLIEDHYGDEPASGVPRTILVPRESSDGALLVDWLSSSRGGPVDIRVPLRGDKRALLDTVTMNAREELMRHRLKRAADHNSRSRAMTELQQYLDLPEAPLRIECYDMAHLQGTDYVGSMVVLEDGLPAKREYRRFKVKDVPGNDDYAAMREVLTRRLSAYLKEREVGVDVDDASGKTTRRRFAYPPQLLLVDGGKGQLGVAVDVVRTLGLEDEIPVAALAKKLEEVFVPGRSEPVAIPRATEAMFMLQRIRDEAHRFANTFHRELRAKRTRASVLDGIPGLGDSRKSRLLKQFGSVKAIKEAGLDALLAVSWLPESVARAVHERLKND